MLVKLWPWLYSSEKVYNVILLCKNIWDDRYEDKITVKQWDVCIKYYRYNNISYNYIIYKKYWEYWGKNIKIKSSKV